MAVPELCFLETNVVKRVERTPKLDWTSNRPTIPAKTHGFRLVRSKIKHEKSLDFTLELRNLNESEEPVNYLRVVW